VIHYWVLLYFVFEAMFCERHIDKCTVSLKTFTVHGSTLPLEYLKLTIDTAANAANGPDAFGPFSWKRVPKA
jgi:hypothetical protein